MNLENKNKKDNLHDNATQNLMLIRELMKEKELRKDELKDRLEEKIDKIKSMHYVDDHFILLLNIVLDAKAGTFKNSNCVFARETLQKYEKQLKEHESSHYLSKEINKLIYGKGEIAKLEKALIEMKANNLDTQQNQIQQIEVLRQMGRLVGC